MWKYLKYSFLMHSTNSSFIQEVGTVLPIKNRAMIKMSSVLDLMELKVEVIKIFLPLLVSLLNEYSILLILSKQIPYSPDAMSRTGMCVRSTSPIATCQRCHFVLFNKIATCPRWTLETWLAWITVCRKYKIHTGFQKQYEKKLIPWWNGNILHTLD